MLMAGPAVNIASILVVRKSMGRRFTWIYLLSIVGFSILFGLMLNLFSDLSIFNSQFSISGHSACCPSETASPSVFQIICSSLLVLLIINALTMKFFSKFKKQEAVAGTAPESDIRKAVEQAGFDFKGVKK